MQNKYMQPIQLFIVFEKLNSKMWISKKLNSNHSIALIPSNWFYSINLFLKRELLFSNITLIENSAIDTISYNLETNQNDLDKTNIENYFFKNKMLVFYNYYNYFLKSKLTLFIILNNLNKSIDSIDRIFANANWLERETSEMYGINYKWKIDTRKLLLDYSKIENPMLKEFQSEGTQDAFYNIFENQVVVLKNETVEL
uniref:NADH dehydrogenase subunit 9 n=1 Tax=Tetrahymena thermophila TaxID=5911 RepID=Q950Z4_TETTH|nr:NADH dehydrogenase subunit 9 [Tetrahymena thermophila]7TGH_S3 Chain S3, NADH dehydrogenase subunit 9 [Tetrahymena thermophila]8GYM_S3 Chain S3, NADH dehydrogenase subunit 9 [Tetrahymena thermophila SB210]8GYM_s3 Chain s3, NADH dehydrogenase subunit 9 [Tetrahymena thermophila SB210]8GZU_S3 Chain S3, NADH dehydrogenase subunit 9 [Tetrahymena thermophila SB210]8GZU_s3 Chain s3, NADH dehydrogenase subunit 9 [Tetrahymena thermophila SB210]AAK77589.1 NADH dehydrogenase subunit 9 [Tetrahymena the